MTRIPALFVLCSSTLVGCVPDHYAVAATRGPNNVTFAQRNPQGRDYLVDCAVDAAGKPSICRTVSMGDGSER